MATYKVKNPFRSGATGQQYKRDDKFVTDDAAAVKAAIAADVIYPEPVKGGKEGGAEGKPPADNTPPAGPPKENAGADTAPAAGQPTAQRTNARAGSKKAGGKKAGK